MVEKKLEPVCQACGETVDPEVTCSECGAPLMPKPGFVEKGIDTREKIQQTLELDIKKDRKTSELTLLTGLSAYTPEPLNLFLKGPSSSGKSHITVNALQYLPDEDTTMLGDLSPKALVHQQGTLVDEDGNPLPPKPGKDADKEEKREWKRKARNAKNLIDLQEKIMVFLEPPSKKTFEMLRPILSHDTWEHTYKFAESGSSGIHTNEVILRGWPAAIFCTTRPGFLEDLVTRSLTITPNMTHEKFKAANRHTASKFENPLDDPEEAESKDELRDYIRTIAKIAKNTETAVPYASTLVEPYPSDHRQAMRDFKKFLSIVRIQALIHAFERPVIEVNGEWVLASTAEDLANALELFEKAFMTTQTGVSEEILNIYKDVFCPLQGEKPGYDEILEKYQEERNDPISREWLRTKVIKPLERVGWLDVQPDPDDKRKKQFRIQGEIKTFENLWGEIQSSINKETVKDWLENILRNPDENGNLFSDVGCGNITTAYGSIASYDAVDMEGFIDKIVNHKSNFGTENKAPSGDQSDEDAGKNAQRHSKVSEDLDDMEHSQREKHRRMLEIIWNRKGTTLEVRELRRRAEEEGLVDEKEIGGFFPTFLEKAEKEWGIVSIDDGTVEVL